MIDIGKGELILKAIYGLLTSPKKRTDEFVFFAFLLFTANLSIHFLGESTARQSLFLFYLTFRDSSTQDVCKMTLVCTVMISFNTDQSLINPINSPQLGCGFSNSGVQNQLTLLTVLCKKVHRIGLYVVKWP